FPRTRESSTFGPASRWSLPPRRRGRGRTGDGPFWFSGHGLCAVPGRVFAAGRLEILEHAAQQLLQRGHFGGIESLHRHALVVERVGRGLLEQSLSLLRQREAQRAAVE